MSSLFDFDCPHTPDGDLERKKQTPPMSPSKRPRISRKDPHHMTESSFRSKSTPRSSSTPRRVVVGLEPEEYIAPKDSIRNTSPMSAPSSTNVAVDRPRAFSSGMAGFEGLSGQPGAPSYHVPPAPSSGPSADTAAPNSDGDMPGSNLRTNLGERWKQQFVDEGDGKDSFVGFAISNRYGLSPQEHQHFYGKSTTNPFEDKRENMDFDNDNVTYSEIGLNAKARNIDNCNNHDRLSFSVFEQANQIRHTGYYQNDDDFSFNQANLSEVPISPREVGSPRNKRERKAHVRNNLFPGLFSAFNPDLFQNGGMRSYFVTSETNIAPRVRGSSSEWYAQSPKVSFDTSFNPDGARGIAGHWKRLSPAKKISVGVIFVVLVCTLMGVVVSETKKESVAKENAAFVVTVETDQPTPSPTMHTTSQATDFSTLDPTYHPTRKPTREPISRSPIAGNGSMHAKDSDGTRRPSRMPITMKPTKSPTGKPSYLVTVIEQVQAAPACTDTTGFFVNHLDKLASCDWLGEEPGFTDRKNKNCGTEWPDGSIYPVTDLGAKCPYTCGLYNGCESQRAQEFEYLQPSANTGEMLCQDQMGLFQNHLDNLKDCAWLYNDKDGHTDRKSKNCGWANYPRTELGWNCPQTCIYYNQNGCWEP